jgi:hypothetical protein
VWYRDKIMFEFLLRSIIRSSGAHVDYEKSLAAVLEKGTHPLIQFLTYRKYKHDVGSVESFAFLFKLDGAEYIWEDRKKWKRYDMVGNKVDNSRALEWGCPDFCWLLDLPCSTFPSRKLWLKGT